MRNDYGSYDGDRTDRVVDPQVVVRKVFVAPKVYPIPPRPTKGSGVPGVALVGARTWGRATTYKNAGHGYSLTVIGRFIIKGMETFDAQPDPGDGCSKWTLGCGVTLLLLAGVGIGAYYLVPAGIRAFGQAVSEAIAEAKAEREILLAETFPNNDPAQAYERADERFRERYTLEQLTTFLNEHPGVFRPPANRVSLHNKRVNGESCTSTAYEVNGQTLVVYATKGDEGYQLLGLGPGMDEAVPGGLLLQE